MRYVLRMGACVRFTPQNLKRIEVKLFRILYNIGKYSIYLGNPLAVHTILIQIWEGGGGAILKINNFLFVSLKYFVTTISKNIIIKIKLLKIPSQPSSIITYITECNYHLLH